MNLIDFFLDAYKDATPLAILLEATAFVFGIASVYYSKKEHIWVYPTGLVATIITTYLLYTVAYYGDMMMNVYYTIMSIYGWYNWSRVKNHETVVKISRTNTREKWIGVVMFVITLGFTYAVYKGFGKTLELTNYIDIFTSGLFFTAMWYMAQKKLENWTLWIIADFITVPLYAYRGMGMLSLQYVIFTVLAIQGYRAWRKKITD